MTSATNAAKFMEWPAPLELWWQDEARVGQQGSLTYIRAEQGSRPPALRDQRYDWAYVFGAVWPARETGVGLVLTEANAQAMNLHLAEAWFAH